LKKQALDFDDGQRLEYLSLCEAKLALASSLLASMPGLLHLADRLIQDQICLLSLLFG
jgi:hypothetical protein